MAKVLGQPRTLDLCNLSGRGRSMARALAASRLAVCRARSLVGVKPQKPSL